MANPSSSEGVPGVEITLGTDAREYGVVVSEKGIRLRSNDSLGGKNFWWMLGLPPRSQLRCDASPSLRNDVKEELRNDAVAVDFAGVSSSIDGWRELCGVVGRFQAPGAFGQYILRYMHYRYMHYSQ